MKQKERDDVEKQRVEREGRINGELERDGDRQGVRNTTQRKEKKAWRARARTMKKKPFEGTKATARGFEPLRAEPNGFLVHHLNHSVTLSLVRISTEYI